MGWNISGKIETCRFVVRRLFSVVTRMIEIVKQYFIQRLITISNLLLQVIIILFHIFFSCFSKWNFIGYFLRQMSFKIYIDSRVSVLFLIPPTRKRFFRYRLNKKWKILRKNFAWICFACFSGIIWIPFKPVFRKDLSGKVWKIFSKMFYRLISECFI